MAKAGKFMEKALLVLFVWKLNAQGAAHDPHICWEKLKVTSTVAKAGKFMKKALLAFVVRKSSLIHHIQLKRLIKRQEAISGILETINYSFVTLV